MATDYIIFIHGVNPREGHFQPTYADELFRLIQKASKSSSRTLKKVALYWADVNEEKEHEILKAHRESPIWKDFWFREFREKQILQFTSNVALYISRYAGSRVVDKLNKQVLAELSGYQPEDRLHLVTHSLGTFILFDILFAAHWDQQDVLGYTSVSAIRQAIYGVEPDWEKGIRLASISTMGSPIGLFSFMDVDRSERLKVTTRSNVINSYYIPPRLQMLLERLQKAQGRKLFWLNFAHPGDPMASPFIPLLLDMVDAKRRYLDIQDVILRSIDLSDLPMQPSNQALFTLLYSAVAHNSYWQSEEVAQKIVLSMGRSSIST